MSATTMMTLEQALAWLPGGRLFGAADTPIKRVHTDTRTLQPGDLFVALHGERFDANTMLAQAKASGAAAALCHPGASGGFAQHGLPCIEVDDTLAALGTLGTAWRAQFTLPLIAVTGSNGKTTVTQMIASILRAAVGGEADASLATQGNYNNDIGVPLTLLRLRASHKLAVVELGMNHPGEIAKLAAMAKPTVALVNNAQREHMEFMATVEAVAQENGEVFRALAADGVAVFPADEPYCELWRGLAAGRRCSTFAWDRSAHTGADVSAAGAAFWEHSAWQAAAHTPAGELLLTLHIAGQHNVKNALAATACALAAGLPLEAIGRGLAAFEPVKGRSRALPVSWQGRAITLVDDSYNANPDSVLAAIDVLAALPAPRLLVLGDMGEVGDQGPQFHSEMGLRARQVGLEHVFTLGALATHVSSSFGAGRHFESIDALNAAVREMLPEVASILVKGSRFMQMPRVVEFVQTQTQPNPLAASATTTKMKEPPHAA